MTQHKVSKSVSSYSSAQVQQGQHLVPHLQLSSHLQQVSQPVRHVSPHLQAIVRVDELAQIICYIVVLKAVNWTSLVATCPAVLAPSLTQCKAHYESVKGELALVPEPTKINWDHYSGVVKNAALVAKLQAAHSAFVVPYPVYGDIEGDNEARHGMEGEAVEVIAASKVAVVAHHARLEKIAAMKPFEDMSVEEHMADNPEKVAEWEKKCKEIGWM